jgi:hypothetical protein
MIPALIVPFRLVRAEYFIMLALPAITSFNPMVLVESNRLNLLRLWLRAEARVLRFDLLHLLRIGLLPFGPRFSLHVLLAGCGSCAGFSCGLLHALTLLALLNLLFAAVRRHSRRTTGNVRSRRGSIPRFLVRASLPAFSSTGLSRRFTGRFSGDVRVWGVRRFVAHVSFLAPVRARLIRGTALIRRAALLHRSLLLLRTWGLRLRRIRLGLCLSRARFFRGALAL